MLGFYFLLPNFLLQLHTQRMFCFSPKNRVLLCPASRASVFIEGNQSASNGEESLQTAGKNKSLIQRLHHKIRKMAEYTSANICEIVVYLQDANLNLCELNQKWTKEKQINYLEQNPGNQVSLHYLIAPFHHVSECLHTFILKRYQSCKDAFKFISIWAKQDSRSSDTL